jgi:hypothetical protein
MGNYIIILIFCVYRSLAHREFAVRVDELGGQGRWGRELALLDKGLLDSLRCQRPATETAQHAYIETLLTMSIKMFQARTRARSRMNSSDMAISSAYPDAAACKRCEREY